MKKYNSIINNNISNIQNDEDSDSDEDRSSSNLPNLHTPLLKRNRAQQNSETLETIYEEEPPVSPYLLMLRVFEVIVLLVVMGLITMPPFIAQILINKAQIEVLSTSISNPTGSSFYIKMNAILRSPVKANAFTYPTKVNVKYLDKKVGSMIIPKMELNSKETLLEIEDKFDILDENVMTEVAKDLIINDKVSWSVEGSLTVYAIGMKLKGLSLNQKMELKGMSGLKQIQIKGIDLPSNHPSGGIKIIANSTLINPTNNSIELGGVKYGLFYQNLLISEVQTEKLTLLPGSNELNLMGRLLKQEEENLDLVSQFVSKYVNGIKLPIIIKGLGIDGNLKWLDQAIKQHEVELELINPNVQQFVKGINILDLSTNFLGQSDFEPLTSAKIKAVIEPPFAFPLSVVRVSENLTLYHNTTSIRFPVKMGNLDLPSLPAKSKIDKELTVLTKYSNIPLIISSSKNGRRAFEKFLTEMVYDEFAKVNVKGSINTIINTAIGELNLQDVPLSLKIKFPGMKGMRDPPPKLKSLEVIGSRGNKVLFQALVALENPTNVSGKLGDVNLDIFYEGVLMGAVKLKDFSIIANNVSDIKAFGYFTLPRCELHQCYTGDDLVRMKFLGKYVNSQPLEIASLGNNQTTSITPLQPALKLLNYTMKVPSIPSELLKSSKYSIFSNGMILELDNPFSNVTIVIYSLYAEAYYHDNLTAIIDLDFRDPGQTGLSPITLPPNRVTLTKPLPVTFVNAGWDLIWKALGGYLQLNVTTGIRLSLNEYKFALNFTKENVDSKVGL